MTEETAEKRPHRFRRTKETYKQWLERLRKENEREIMALGKPPENVTMTF